MSQAPRIALQIEKDRVHGRAMIEGIASYALEAGWQLELTETRLFSSLRQTKGYAGFIVRIMDDRTERLLAASGKCAVDTYGRNDSRLFDTIRLDDDAIAMMAADCFHDHRFRNMAYCGFPGLRFSDRRGTAFARAAKSDHADCSVYSTSARKIKDTFFRNESMGAPADAEALTHWLRALPKPVAIFCCNDLRAYQLLNICRNQRIEVPRDVAILGVDNDALLCTFANPPLSSIDTNPFALGYRAAELLDRQMACKNRHKPVLIKHRPQKIVERASTEAYPAATSWLSDAIAYIRRHLSDGISAADVIRHLGYSHTTVGKVFAAEVGCSVQQEIIRQRITRACRLLRETDMTAAKIATVCGYPSAQYFAHAFADRFSETPGRWRQKKSDKRTSG